MKAVLLISILLFSVGLGHFCLAQSAPAALQTKCVWIDTISNEEFVSSFTELTSIQDCVNGLGVTLLVILADQGDLTYDGQFLLMDAGDKILGSCISRTLQVASEKMSRDILSWLLPNRRKTSDEDFLEMLRTPLWQERIKSHFGISCQPPPQDAKKE